MVGCEILVWNIGVFIGTGIHTYRSAVNNYFILIHDFGSELIVSQHFFTQVS